MEFVKTNIDDLTIELKLSISPEDYNPIVLPKLKELRKTASFKGFRAGKVPMGFVKKMFGNQVLSEEISKMVTDEVNKYMDENEINPIARPLQRVDDRFEVNLKDNKTYDFYFDIGLRPDFEISVLHDDQFTINKYKVEVGDDAVGEEIQRILKQNATLTNPDNLKEEDAFQVKLEQVDEQGEVVEGGIANETWLGTADLKDGMGKDLVMDLAVEESVEVDIFELLDKTKPQIVKHVLGIESEDGEADAETEEGEAETETEATTIDAPKQYKLTLSKVNRMVPAEMNEELFEKLFPEQEIADEADFKERIREYLESYPQRAADRRMHDELFQIIMDTTEMPLPEDLLKKLIVSFSGGQEVTEEQLEREYEGFSKSLKWNLIKGELVKNNDIEITEEDVRKQARAEIMQMLMQYNLPGFDDAMIDKMVERRLTEDDHKEYNRIAEALVEHKIFEYLEEELSVMDIGISQEDFTEILEKEAKEKEATHAAETEQEVVETEEATETSEAATEEVNKEGE